MNIHLGVYYIRIINNDDFAGKNLAVCNHSCGEVFPDKWSIFRDDFRVKKSSIKDNLSAYDDNIFLDFEIRDNLIKMVNEDLITNADSSATT